MIFVKENDERAKARYYYYRADTRFRSPYPNICCSATVSTPTSQVDVDYLSQWGSYGPTGWKGVVHGKATGYVTRYFDGVTHSDGKPNVDFSHTSKGQLYVTDGEMYKSSLSSLTWLIPFRRVCSLVQIYDRSDTLTRQTLSFRILSAYVDTAPDGRVFIHAIELDSGLKYNKITESMTVNGWASANYNTGGSSHPNPDAYSDFTSYLNRQTLMLESTILSRKTYSSPARTEDVALRHRAPVLPRSNETIRRTASGELAKLSQASNTVFYRHLGEIQAPAFDSINRFDGNMLALLGDLKSMGSASVRTVTDLMHASDDPRRLASAWLSARYGDRLTISDVKDLLGGFSRPRVKDFRGNRFLFGRSRYSLDAFEDMSVWHQLIDNFHADGFCEIALSPKDYNALMSLVRKAYEIDLYPSLQNVWDLIPLSFVVDWFVNVSKIFEDVDRLVQSRYYNVNCVLNTVKASSTGTALEGLSYSFYERHLTSSLSLGMSSVELGLPSPINIVDGVSLFLM